MTNSLNHHFRSMPLSPAPTTYSHGLWQRYDTIQGLSSSGIYALTEDADGRLWIGTGDGLAVFDSLSWTATLGCVRQLIF